MNVKEYKNSNVIPISKKTNWEEKVELIQSDLDSHTMFNMLRKNLVELLKERGQNFNIELQQMENFSFLNGDYPK